MNTELALCANDDERRRGSRPVIDFYFDVPPISNTQIQNMWKRQLRIGPRWLLQPAYSILKALGFKALVIDSPAEDRDISDCLTRKAPFLGFTSQEEREARAQVAELLGSEDAQWVCLHQRDSAYLSQSMESRDWSYHSYRDTPISDYQLAAEMLAREGYKVVRMGKIVSQHLPFEATGVIDYPLHPLRSDVLDVYLAAHCAFFLSTGSGIDSVATVFRRPQVLVNFPSPFHPLTGRPNHIFIYQHFRDSDTGDPLSLHQLYERQAWQLFSTNDFDQAGISLSRNSSQEIADAATEMSKRLQGVWRESYEAEIRQEKFWRAFRRIPEIHGLVPFRARIGSEFLAANEHLYAK